MTRAAELPPGDIRRRYVASRAALRHALADRVGVAPGDVRFAPRSCVHCGSTRHGKPTLDRGYGRTGVEFNMSHSEDLVAIAVADDVAVGIDIEAGLPQDPDGIARRFFTHEEQRAPLSPAAFQRLWARKEAALKVGGRGLAAGLSFDVSQDRVRLHDGQLVWVRDVPAQAACAVAAAGRQPLAVEVGLLDPP